MKYPKVSIIILNWNGLEDTVECLESLKQITYPNYEVIVVDNGSTSNDAQVLREKFGNYIHLIENNKNYGYPGGINIGMQYALKYSSSDYFLLLNNDTKVAPDFLSHLVKMAEADITIGVVGPNIYWYHLPNRIQNAGGKVNMWTGQSSHIGMNQVDDGQSDSCQEVDYVGPCMLIKNKIIQEVGLFDESYFCYWEDVDYCIRVRKQGYKVVCIPCAKIWHKGLIRLKPWYRTLRKSEQVTTPLYALYFSTRNSFKFMRKHATKLQYCVFLLYFFAFRFFFAKGVFLLYHRDVKLFVAFCRGVRDGLFGSNFGADFYI